MARRGEFGGGRGSLWRVMLVVAGGGFCGRLKPVVEGVGWRLWLGEVASLVARREVFGVAGWRIFRAVCCN